MIFALQTALDCSNYHSRRMAEECLSLVSRYFTTFSFTILFTSSLFLYLYNICIYQTFTAFSEMYPNTYNNSPPCLKFLQIPNIYTFTILSEISPYLLVHNPILKYLSTYWFTILSEISPYFLVHNPI